MDGNTIPMFGPDGKLHDVSHDDADKALASGGERAILFHAPDGKQRYVKHSQLKDALNAGGFVANPEDLTIQPGKEGLYKMAGPGGKQAPVPYSLVGSAAKLGYVMDQEDRKKYMADASADPALHNMKLLPGVKATGRNIAGQVQVAPDDAPKEGFFSNLGTTLKQGAEGVLKLIDPVETPEEKQRDAKSGTAGKVYDAALYPFERLVEPNIREGQRAKQEAEGGSKYEAAMHGTAAAIPFLGPAAEGAREQFAQNEAEGNWKGLAGSGAGNVFLAEAPHLVEPFKTVAAKAVSSLPENIRGTIRNLPGVDITNKTEDAVEKFKNKTEKVRADNQTSEERTNKERGVVDTANQKAAAQHETDLAKHADRLRVLSEKHQKNLEKAQKAHADSLAKHQEETHTTQQNNAKDLQKHIADVEEISKNNQAADAEMDARQALEQQHETLSGELDKRIEAAEKKAEADNKAAWDNVRQKTAGQSTDISNLQQVAGRAADQADPATSAIFKRIIQGEQSNLPALTRQSRIVRYVDSAGNTIDPMTMGSLTLEGKIKSGEYKVESVPETVNPDDEGYGDLYEAQFGEPPPIGGGPAQFNRLQRWYTYISNKMYGGGRVEGGLFHAYQMVRNAINDAMQDIAQKSNAVPDLENARKLHTEKMEAFSDNPNEPATAASKVKSETIPKRVKKTKLAENTAKVARYDPDIAKIQEQIQSIDQRLGKMRTEEQLRAAKKPAPTPPTPKPVPGPHPDFVPPEPPEMPDAPEADPPIEYTDPHATKPLPDAAKLGQNIHKSLNRGLRKYGAIGPWVLRSIVGGEALHLLFQGHLSTFGTTMLIGQTAVSILANALRRPSVIEWLAKPTADDLHAIDQLPPADAARVRQALGALAAEDAHRMGAKSLPAFDPKIARFLLGAGASRGQQPTLEQLRKEAEQRKPQQQAAPGPQSSAQQPNWTHEYDETSGKIVPVNA